MTFAACDSTTTQQMPDDLSLSTANEDLAVADDLAMRAMDLAARDLAARDLAMPDLAKAGDLGLTPAPGQCWNDSQCPNGSCAVEAAGGICSGCSVLMDYCPTDYDTCAGPACSTGCSTADDCPQPPVQACILVDGEYVCAQKSCNGAGQCGPLHECRGGFCKRILCPNGNECPAGSTCRGTSTKVCVEDHLTFP